MVNNPLNVKDIQVANVETLLTNLETLIITLNADIILIRNDIEEMRGRQFNVTQGTSNFAVTEENPLTTIDISNQPIGVTESSPVANITGFNLEATQAKIAKEEVDDDIITKGQTKNAQIILLYYFNTGNDRWERVDESLFQSGGLSISGEGNLGLDIGGVATAAAGLLVGGVAAGASVLIDSGGNAVPAVSETDDDSIAGSQSLPTGIQLLYGWNGGTPAWERATVNNSGHQQVNVTNASLIVTNTNFDNMLANQIVQRLIDNHVEWLLQIVNKATSTTHILYNAIKDVSNDIFLTNVVFDCNDTADFLNASVESINIDIRVGSHRYFSKTLSYPNIRTTFDGTNYIIVKSWNLATPVLIPANSSIVIAITNRSGNNLDNINISIQYFT